MEINSKDELNSMLDEIMARLSVIEQSTTEKEEPKEEPKEETQVETKVETEDEIEKLLNS